MPTGVNSAVREHFGVFVYFPQPISPFQRCTRFLAELLVITTGNSSRATRNPFRFISLHPNVSALQRIEDAVNVNPWQRDLSMTKLLHPQLTIILNNLKHQPELKPELHWARVTVDVKEMKFWAMTGDRALEWTVHQHPLSKSSLPAQEGRL